MYEPKVQMSESDYITVDAMDKFPNYQVQIYHNDNMQLAMVNSRKINIFGNHVGNNSSNPLVDTRRYKVN